MSKAVYKEAYTYPALVANALGASAADTNSNDIRRRVEERLAHLLQLCVAHKLRKRVNRHGVDQRLLPDGGTFAHFVSGAMSNHIQMTSEPYHP